MTPNGSTGSSSGYQGITGFKQGQIPNMTPQMMQLFQQLLGGIGGGAEKGLGFLSSLAGGDESAFEDMEAPAYNAFNKTLGQTASRFSQFGAQNSSAFQNAVSGAGADLAKNLQGNRSDMRMKALQQLLGQSNTLLGMKPFENTLQDEGGMDWNQIGGALIQALPQLLALL
jgi:hypothetical protein